MTSVMNSRQALRESHIPEENVAADAFNMTVSVDPAMQVHTQIKQVFRNRTRYLQNLGRFYDSLGQILPSNHKHATNKPLKNPDSRLSIESLGRSPYIYYDSCPKIRNRSQRKQDHLKRRKETMNNRTPVSARSATKFGEQTFLAEPVQTTRSFSTIKQTHSHTNANVRSVLSIPVLHNRIAVKFNHAKSSQ